MTPTLLDRLEVVDLDPFPHFVIENALPEDFYEELVRQRPTPEQIIAGRVVGPNQRVDLPTIDAMRIMSSIWVDFCAAHTSREFVDKVSEILCSEHTGKVTRVECQPGINTPSQVLSKVRGPHLDNPKEIYAGLFYMAEDFDGGDLEIYRWNGPKQFYGKLEVKEECVEWVKTVPYKPNTCVFFLNGPNALHGVTPRKSKNYRSLVNVIAETRHPMFKVGHGNY